MSFKKIASILAAASALVAISIPALAFENEFHGSYALRYFLSNYENGGGGNPLALNSTGNSQAVSAANPLRYTTPFGANGSIGQYMTAPTNTTTFISNAPNAALGSNTTKNLKMNNYFEQRLRLFYTAKANDNLKLVTAFEIDAVFGDKAQGMTTGAAVPAGTGRNQGAAWESDTVNLETKNVYLEFKIPSTPTTVKAGIMTIRDSLKDILFLADAAGILTSTKVGNATINAGYFRGYDQSFFSTNARPRGMDNLDIGLFEAKFAPSKDISAGLVYYLYNDSRNIFGGINGGESTYAWGSNGNNVDPETLMIHTLGIPFSVKSGPVEFSGFFAYQGGVLRNVDNNIPGNANPLVANTPNYNNIAAPANSPKNGNSAYLNAIAYNLAAKVAAGPGTFKTALLFTSGNGSNPGYHYTGWVGTSQSQNSTWSNAAGTSYYSEGGMWLINRNAAAATGTTDNAIVYNTGNGTNPKNSQGLYEYTLGYDANITPKFYTNANLGFAWAARTNALKPTDFATKKQNATNFMGTEINLEIGYKMYDNLTASLGGAYMMLGGYYAGSSTDTSPGLTVAKYPEDPYSIRTTLKYSF